MTETEARAEARRRWGEDRMVPSPHGETPVTTYGTVQDDGTSFGRRYRVGLWVRETPHVGWFRVLGEGASWEAAFADADRRAGKGA